MRQPVRTLIELDDAFARELPELALSWHAAEAPAPELIVLNDPLALELGLDPAVLRSPQGVALLVGTGVPEGAHPVAQAYAGHQFGGWAPRLGDGRALLLGEIVDPDGTHRDLHLKGSGRTPFSRGGDGYAALGPMLREYLISEAMHALGIPTTRSLAVCTTGDRIWRDAMLPGAVLARVASSHLRVGTFQYAAATGDVDLLRRLVDMAIDRHHRSAAGAPNRSLALLEAVVDAQAAVVARWLNVGFVHGVMNTDNTTISGETIDYGPCAFLDAFDPAATYSSIDHAGRYAFGNQPHILQWNLARLAEALLPLVDADQDAAVAQVTEVLEDYPERFERAWRSGMAARLGLSTDPDGDGDGDRTLADDWLRLLHEHHLDHTRSFRALSASVRGNTPPVLPELDTEAEAGAGAGADPAARDAVDAWSARHRARVASHGLDPAAVADGMDHANPIYVPRNHLVEEALAAATAGDLAPFRQLLDAISAPFDERPGLERYAAPAPPEFGPYQTFCGT